MALPGDLDALCPIELKALVVQLLGKVAALEQTVSAQRAEIVRLGAVARSRMGGGGSLLGRQAMRTETGLATRIIRLSTSTPSATSPCWFANVRARNRGPIRAL